MWSVWILYFPFCTSAVAYTVALGLFLAVGRETTGKIPQGKVRAPENFCFPSNVSIWGPHWNYTRAKVARFPRDQTKKVLNLKAIVVLSNRESLGHIITNQPAVSKFTIVLLCSCGAIRAALFVRRYQVHGRVRVGSTIVGTQAAGVQCKVDSSLRSVDIFISPCCFSYCFRRWT